MTDRANYVSMTINERLFVAGQVDAFDAAILARDRESAIALLTVLDMTDKQAAGTVDAVLARAS